MRKICGVEKDHINKKEKERERGWVEREDKFLSSFSILSTTLYLM